MDVSSANVSTYNATNVTVNSPFVGKDIGPVARAFFIAFGSVEVLGGTVGSCLLLTVLFTSRSLGMRSHHYLFIANLALTDLLSMGYWMSFFVLDLILGHHPVVNEAHCVVNGFLICTFSVVTMLSLVSISLNRYLHVCHKHLYSRVFTKGRTIVCCLVLWVLAAMIAGLPVLLGFGLYHYKVEAHVCTFNGRQRATYPKTVSFVLMVGSTLVVGYLNLAIFRFWKRARLNPKRRFSYVSATTTHHRISGCLKCKRWVQKESKDDVHVMQVVEPEGNNKDQNIEETTSGREHESSSRSPVEASENLKEDYDPELDDMSEEDRDDSDLETGGVSDEDRDVSKEDNGMETGDAPEEDRSVSKEDTEPGAGLMSKKERNIPDPDSGLEAGAQNKQRPLELKGEAGARVLKSPTAKSTTTTTKSSLKSDPARSSNKTSGTGNRGSHMKQLSRRRRKQQLRDQAFVRSLFVVFILTLIAFVPFGISRIVETYHGLSVEVAISVTLMLFSNNAVNWIVYGVMNRSFRRGYVTLVRRVTGTCCRYPWKKPP